MNDRKIRYGARPRATRIEQDSDAVFDAAIRAGVLSEDPASETFAGHYMYMHHDGDGAAWFKHRETRAYVTMPPEAPGEAPEDEPKRPGGPGAGLWATLALAGVFLAGAVIDFDRGPPIGTVRLNDLTAEFLADAVQGADSPEQSAQAARVWGLALETALETVAERHGLVLLPVETVAAGAPDYTGEVRAAMRSWQTADPGSAARDDAAPGSRVQGAAAQGGSAPEPRESGE